jgi:hypothetical protein
VIQNPDSSELAALGPPSAPSSRDFNGSARTRRGFSAQVFFYIAGLFANFCPTPLMAIYAFPQMCAFCASCAPVVRQLCAS